MKKKILLVDDEVNILIALTSILEEEYEVCSAINADEALELFARERIDLVLADQRMPGMSGVDMLCRMRQMNPDCIRIVLTAYADFHAVLKATNEGAVYRFVLKPWQPEDMIVTLKRALEHRDADVDRLRSLEELKARNRELEDLAAELRDTRDALVRSEKLAAIGRFAGAMVHEIGNYTAGLSYMQSMRRTYQSDAALAGFFDAVGALTEAVNSILAGYQHYSRGDALRYDFRPTDLAAVAEDALRVVRLSTYSRDIEVGLKTTGRMVEDIDRGRLLQTLINLVKNACQACKPGGHVNLAVLSDASTVRIEIEDDGCGIPSGDEYRIWEPFFSTKGQASLGLGLDICRTIAAGHGGGLHHRAREGGGSVFSLVLPRIRRV